MAMATEIAFFSIFRQDFPHRCPSFRCTMQKHVFAFYHVDYIKMLPVLNNCLPSARPLLDSFLSNSHLARWGEFKCVIIVNNITEISHTRVLMFAVWLSLRPSAKYIHWGFKCKKVFLPQSALFKNSWWKWWFWDYIW